ncbi:unnamed protein product [Symbiodinium sp. CCMP2592]|nr:unnamed protein product [Symbiodinium sp. CCMP2592]
MCRDNAPGQAKGMRTSCVVVDDDEDADSMLGLVNFGGSGGSESASVGDRGSVGADSLGRGGSSIDLDLDLDDLEVRSDSLSAGGSGSNNGREPLADLALVRFQDSQGSQSLQDPQQQSQQAVVPFDNIHRNNPRRWTATALKELRRQDYENMPPQQCAFVAFKASAALQQHLVKCQEQAKQIRMLKRINQRQESIIKKKQKVLDEEQARKSSLEIVPIGKTGKRMSVQSAFAIGVRRNLSNIAAADFGATILTDVSQQRVTRSELKTAAALLCKMRSTCVSVVNSSQHGEEDVEFGEIHPKMEHEWRLSTISMRCDATNSSIWKREKLHVLDVDFAWVEDFAAVRKFDADKVVNELRKELLKLNSAPLEGMVCAGHPSISRCHVFMYMDVTDKGSDQSCRKRCTSEAITAAGCPNLIYLPGICYLHMFNASVKNGLELFDEMLNALFSKQVLAGFTKYFGSVSKVVNCWREKAAEIMMSWDQAFNDSDLDTLKLGRRYPLSVVSGRWGSIESAEDFLLLRGKDRVVPVLLAALSKHMRADTAAPESRSPPTYRAQA